MKVVTFLFCLLGISFTTFVVLSIIQTARLSNTVDHSFCNGATKVSIVSSKYSESAYETEKRIVEKALADYSKPKAIVKKIRSSLNEENVRWHVISVSRNEKILAISSPLQTAYIISLVLVFIFIMGSLGSINLL